MMRFWGMFRFTLGETIRKGTLIFYFTVATAILLVFAFGVGRMPDDPDMVSIFGSPIAKKSLPNFNVVEFILLNLHQQSVSSILLFGIFGVAGLIPKMLEKGTIDLFLSKPLSRAELFLARSFGATTGIALNLIYFFIGIWFIFGLKLGVWHWGFLSSVLYVTYAFACFYSFVALIGMITRSTGFSIMIAFMFMLISWGLELREKGLYILWDNVVYHRLLDALYYLTPQINGMLSNSTLIVGKNPFTPVQMEFTFMPFLYSFFSMAFLYSISIWYFSHQDY